MRASEKSLESLLDEREVAQITGESVATLRRNRLLGKGCPHVKLGALVRYKPSDLRDYIERNVRGGYQAGAR
jgi:predicted DNA-binding transcriptional regulator AlpA